MKRTDVFTAVFLPLYTPRILYKYKPLIMFRKTSAVYSKNGKAINTVRGLKALSFGNEIRDTEDDQLNDKFTIHTCKLTISR